MSKHTPGPWKLKNNGSTFEVSTEDLPIADVHQWVVPNSDLEAEANARLIAAAPELLEAVKGMMRFYCPDEGAPDCKITTLRVLDLIAKAEGTKD